MCHTSRPRKIRRSRWRSKLEPEQDDTLGHRKLAALLHLGKNRIKRVMQKYGLTARRKKKRYVYRGLAAQIVPNLVRELAEDAASEVVFSDILRSS